jgi:hypothetical protein
LIFNPLTFFDFDIIFAPVFSSAAIKPICELLGIEYTRTFKNLKNDEILSQLLAEQPTVGADGKLRKMLCLPEKYIYGWLFSIRSDSPELKEYKLKCYDILYQHFHGALTGRLDVLQQRNELDEEIEALQQKLLESPEHLRIEELKKKKSATTTQLKKLDKDLVSQQIRIHFPSTN